MDASTHSLSASAMNFQPMTTATPPMVPASVDQWMGGHQIPQPHSFEQDHYGYAHGDAHSHQQQHAHDRHTLDAAYHEPHPQHYPPHARRWSQPSSYHGQYVHTSPSPYDFHGGEPSHYHFSPPPSPPLPTELPDRFTTSPSPMSLSGRGSSSSSLRSRSNSDRSLHRRKSCPELGRKATAPTGQRIYLLPKAVNSELDVHGVQLDMEEMGGDEEQVC